MDLKSKLESKEDSITSKYGLKGQTPKGPLNGVGYLPLNDTFSQGTYQDYLVKTINQETVQDSRAQDLTAYKSQG